jgi:hypothetical protein
VETNRSLGGRVGHFPFVLRTWILDGMSEKCADARSRRSPEKLAQRFAERAKTDPELSRRVQEHWAAGDVQGARGIIIDAIDDGDAT